MHEFPIQVQEISLDSVNTQFIKYHKIIDLIDSESDFLDWLNLTSKSNKEVEQILMPYLKENKSSLQLVKKRVFD